MSKLEVFEPAMCCSTGVCGPSVDPALIRFAADMDWLKGQGVEVERNNLSSKPRAFGANEVVRAEMQIIGIACLPLTLIDAEVAWRGAYPTRAQLAERLGLTVQLDDGLDLPMVNPNGCC